MGRALGVRIGNGRNTKAEAKQVRDAISEKRIGVRMGLRDTKTEAKQVRECK